MPKITIALRDSVSRRVKWREQLNTRASPFIDIPTHSSVWLYRKSLHDASEQGDVVRRPAEADVEGDGADTAR